MWTRFFPLVKSLRKLILEDRVIGEVRRVFADYGEQFDMTKFEKGEERLPKDHPGRAGGTLVGMGIYSLTMGRLVLDEGLGETATTPITSGIQTIVGGYDYMTTVVLNYADKRRQGILSSSEIYKSALEFMRVEGTEGIAYVSGVASRPTSFVIKYNDEDKADQLMDFPLKGWGYYYEADAVALDIARGDIEDHDTMPLAETVLIMKIMDEVRKISGLEFPQDA